MRERYRTRHDERASSLLDGYRRTQDEQFLVRLVEDYYLSSPGASATERLADLR